MGFMEGDSQTPRAWLGEMPVTSRYTAGLAGERFFRAIKDEGRILGSHCETCGVTYVPGREFCERCLAALAEWLDVGTQGEVYTYTLVYENLDGSRREQPELVAFISLGDGGLVHRVSEVDPEAISIGMMVEAVFKPEAEREGSILDILYFRPVTG